MIGGREQTMSYQVNNSSRLTMFFMVEALGLIVNLYFSETTLKKKIKVTMSFDYQESYM